MGKSTRRSRKLKLTARHTETLNALRHYIDTHNAAPTFSELSRIVGYNCKDALVALRKRHLITWGERKPRSLTILNTGKIRKTLTRVTRQDQEKQETLPAPAMSTEGSPNDSLVLRQAIMKNMEAPLQFLNNKTIVSAAQPDALHLALMFSDGSTLRIDVQADDEGPSLGLFLSTEVRLKA